MDTKKNVWVQWRNDDEELWMKMKERSVREKDGESMVHGESFGWGSEG